MSRELQTTGDPFSKIKTDLVSLRNAQNTLTQSIEPNDLLGRLRKAVAKIPGLSGLGTSNVDEVTASLRDSALNVYQDLGQLLKEGHRLNESYGTIQDLVDSIKADPKDQPKVDQLRDILRRKAEEGLRLERDAETEALIAEVLTSDNPANPEESIQQNLIAEADKLLNVIGPTVHTIEAVLRNSVKVYDSQVAMYATYLHVGDTIKALDRASGNLVDAAALRITSFNTLAGSLSLTLKAAELGARAAEIGRQLDVTVNKEKLLALSRQADQLLVESGSLNQPSSSDKK